MGEKTVIWVKKPLVVWVKNLRFGYKTIPIWVEKPPSLGKNTQYGQKPLDLGTKPPDLGLNPLHLCRNPPQFRQKPPDLGPKAPDLGLNPPVWVEAP